MGISRDELAQIAHLLRPLATRMFNVVARGVVQLVDDDKKLQLVQLGVLANETVEGKGTGAEHFQAYGFTSVPLAGAESVVLFPNGDRSHPLVVATSDRRYRITGGKPGEVTVYNNTGAKITMTKDGDIIAVPAAGRQVIVNDGTGGGPLVTQAQFMNHTHLTAGTGAPVAPTALVPSPALTGTTVLTAK